MNHLKFNPTSGFPALFNSLFEEASAVKETKNSVPVNIFECKDSLEIEMALPGFSKDNINLHLDENRNLRISGKPQEQEKSGQAIIRRQEFLQKEFTKNFRLGKGLNTEEINADFQNGILRISISKSNPDTQKNIRQIPLN